MTRIAIPGWVKRSDNFTSDTYQRVPDFLKQYPLDHIRHIRLGGCVYHSYPEERWVEITLKNNIEVVGGSKKELLEHFSHYLSKADKKNLETEIWNQECSDKLYGFFGCKKRGPFGDWEDKPLRAPSCIIL